MAATKKTEEKTGLAQTHGGKLSKQHPIMSIGVLEKELLKKFPATDGEEWDRNGLLVGDPAALVGGIAVALDPTVDAVHEAKALGANVLLTHHPAYLSAPDSFRPAGSALTSPGAGVYAAIEDGVALINLHTPLDVSREAAQILPGLLNLRLMGIVEPLKKDAHKGYGQLCSVKPADGPLTLGQLAARCTSVFGRPPRVWGDFGKALSKVVTCTGSTGDLPGLCMPLSVDCLVCGEVRYHDALTASHAGLAIIDLGHDVSELPLVAVLATAVSSLGFSEDSIMVIGQRDNWAYPESVRI